MSASRNKDRHETEQEETELEEQRQHDERECKGYPWCYLCIDEWEEANREELDKQGYYDWNGRWTT